jgi:hypothetical protein
MGGAAMFMVFAFIGGAPEVYIEQSASPRRGSACCFALTATGFIAADAAEPLAARAASGIWCRDMR